ncbi:MAG: hypothetical protein AB7F23_10240 [Phycisphaerae bacterium]|jgi:hypothetical protein
MRKITKIILKLFIIYFIFGYVITDRAKLYPGRNIADYCLEDTLLIRGVRPFYYRDSTMCLDYFPYIGPDRQAKLKFSKLLICVGWPGAVTDIRWCNIPKRPWSPNKRFRYGETDAIAKYCSGYLARHDIPPYDSERIPENELERDVFLMPDIEKYFFTIRRTNTNFTCNSHTFYVISLDPLVVSIAPVTAVSKWVDNDETEMICHLDTFEYFIANRVPSHEDLLWFSPDMDVLPQPLEKVSENEQRIKVPWGWLVYKKETATHTIRDGVCPEIEDREYQVDYWQVYAEKKDYYDDF